MGQVDQQDTFMSEQMVNEHSGLAGPTMKQYYIEGSSPGYLVENTKEDIRKTIV